MFAYILCKEYPRDLYDKQFALYIDKILARIDMQYEAFKKEDNVPNRLFEIYDEQKKDLLDLKEKFGAVVLPEKAAEWAAGK